MSIAEYNMQLLIYICINDLSEAPQMEQVEVQFLAQEKIFQNQLLRANWVLWGSNF